MKTSEFHSRTAQEDRRTAYDPEAEKKVATALWKPVGSFCLLASLALLAAMTSEKVGPGLMSFIGQDAFGITLFGIPVLSGALIALALIGSAYRKVVQARSPWTMRIPPIVEGVDRSSLGFRVNVVIFLGFLVLPWMTLGLANAKFFEGTYYFAADASKGCGEKQTCERMGSGWNHFQAKHGLSLTNTAYRYEGNKTYLPIVYPALLVGLSFWASVLCTRYLYHLFLRK